MTRRRDSGYNTDRPGVLKPGDILLTVALAIEPEQFDALVSGRARGPVSVLLRAALRAVSVPYGGVVRLRNWLYDRGWKRTERASVPVVSIGNLTLGGTGKTPCVEYVARFYRQHERRVALLSRGYGAGNGPNDEALVLEENLPDVPHYQGADRVALARTAVEESESEVLVLDDGFQHRRLARELDLVLIDASQPWGHGCLFPRGLLREPPTSLRRAHVVLLTRCDQVSDSERGRLREEIAQYAPGVPLVETVHQPIEWIRSDQRTAGLDCTAARPAVAFCGLGNPEAFRHTLRTLGIDIQDFRTYPDHHAYTRADVEALRAWAAGQAKDCLIVTTQKDLVKLRVTQLSGRELWALRIGLHISSGEEELHRRLRSVIASNAEG